LAWIVLARLAAGALCLPWLQSAPAASAPSPGEVLDRAVNAYRSLAAYQDTGVLTVTLDVEGSDADQLPAPEPEEFALAFAGPNRLMLKTPMYAVYCDGRTLWEHATPIEQYVQGEAPDSVDLGKLQLARFNAFEQSRHPLAALLTGTASGPAALLGGEIVRLEAAEARSIDDRPGHRVTGVLRIRPGGEKDEEVPFEAWFDGATGLMHRLAYDHTAWMRRRISSVLSNAKLNRYAEEFRLKPVDPGKPIPPERFGFTPAPHDERVTALRPPSPQEMQQKLVGRPAPEFSGKDFEGRTVGRDDLKDKVVVLDFWAVWCGPCLMALPGLQQLADKYAGKPVVFLGVNTDPAASRAEVAGVLKSRKITFRQIADESNAITRAFRVVSFPTMAVIGRDGTVQAIHVGYSPDEMQALSRDIDRLLKGESLTRR